MMTKLLPLMNVGEMYFYRRQGDGGNRIANAILV